MHTNLKIALRFLLAKKRSMLMSLVGIAMGVGFIILTQAITSGFQEFFVNTIVGTDGPMRVEDKMFQDMTPSVGAVDAQGRAIGSVTVESNRKYQEGVAEPRLLGEAIKRFPDVTSVSAVLRGNIGIQSAVREDAGQVFGIELDDHLAVSDLGNQIIIGSIDDFKRAQSGVIVGSVLSNRLGLKPGDSVLISYAGQSTRYKVAAIFETGIRDIDKVRVFMKMQEARILLNKPYGATYLQVGLRDINKAPEVAEQISALTSHVAKSWQEREQIWLAVFQFFRVMAAIIVFTIIVVSGLGMFNTLFMIVMEKTKEIAILRSMGFTRGDIAFVFIMQGAMVLVAGVVAGCAFGALATWAVSKMPMPSTGLFVADHIVVAWRIAHYVGAAAASAVVVVIASLLPARRAAGLEPAAIIRGASQ